MEEEQQIIGRGTWIDKLADELLQREKSLRRKTDLIRVESGLGASGIPHIGSLGDAVRAYGVKLALENLGFKSELIAYSDDLDGLRKIPEGLPETLKEHIGKPVSFIPDPFGCHDSYGLHMSSILLDGLDKLGIKYKFQRGVDTYRNGLLKEQIHTILTNSKKIGEKIAEMVGQEKYQEALPYFPVCANCEKLYTATSYEYLSDEKKIKYRCADTTIGSKPLKGCGHDGIADITKDLGKLPWKVEFAARWSAFDIRFEAYGKDIMDSVKVNDWVSEEILGFPAPTHVKYEMFLDKGGKKISKSLGNVLTSQAWLRYGTPKTILLLLTCSINVTFKPTVGGTRTGTLTVNDNAAPSPQTAGLTGTGNASGVNLLPTSLTFSSQVVGTSSPSQGLTLSNSLSTTVTISSIVITGANAGDFSQTNNCGTSVAAGANCTISVTFKPTATGTRNASLTVTESSPNAFQTVILTGTGISPVVTLSPTN